MRIAYILDMMVDGWLRYELDALSDLRADISVHPAKPATYGTFEGQARYLRRTAAGDLVRAGLTSSTHPVTASGLFRELSSYAGKKIALAALSTARIVGRQKPDIIHAHFATTPAASARMVSKLTGIPYGFTAHGGYDLTKGHIDRELLTVNCRDAAFVRCISDYGRRRLVTMTGVDESRFHVIHCGVDIRYFVPPEPSQDGRRREKTIITVASLVEPKGIPYLLDALSDPALKGLGYRSLIIGDGPLRGELEAQAARLVLPVTFAGAVKNNEIRRFYYEADLFALPCVTGKDGHHDGIPVALMEAMACGVPVISTRLSGIPELVEDGRSGILVPEKDAHALAGALRRLLTDDDLEKRLSYEGRKRVVEQFEIRDVAERLMNLFTSSVQQAGGL